MDNLIIIGSGLAGYMLAKEWRKLDVSTPLVIITHSDGSFYSKPLLSTALTQQKTPENLVIADCAQMAGELKADIYNHAQVTAIDPINNIITFCDMNTQKYSQLSFGRLVLACGAQKIFPSLIGDAIDEVYSVNNLEDYRRFYSWLAGKKKIIILGSGLVGCEFANDLVNAGYQVTVVAPESHPLAMILPAVMGGSLQQALASLGVVWELGHLAVEINHAQNHYKITLSNHQHCYADGVLSAIGLRPETSLAKQSGIRVNRGIVVNRWLQTNFPHIYALGDCAEVDGLVQMYVAPLLQCARALAKILCADLQAVHYPVMPIVLKTPALPLVFTPPPENIRGEWHVEGEGRDLRALYYDHEGQLRGFILVGSKIRDKLSLAKQLPVIFNE